MIPRLRPLADSDGIQCDAERPVPIVPDKWLPCLASPQRLLSTDHRVCRQCLVDANAQGACWEPADRSSRPGRPLYPSGKRRDHVVSVLLNDAELAVLDELRGKASPGAFFRGLLEAM